TAAASADDADAIAGEQAGPGPVGDATVDAARPGEERGGVAVAAVDGAAAADDHAAVDDDAAVHDDAAAGRQAQLHDPEVDADHGSARERLPRDRIPRERLARDRLAAVRLARDGLARDGLARDGLAGDWL